MAFNTLSLISPLLQAVADAGYTKPSPIQQKAIPSVLAERDLLGCAQTGTGKTAAFALPILQLLTNKPPVKKGAIRALILTPTRELALQIEESFTTYSKYLPLRTTVIFGGVGQAPQVAALRKGVDVLVATPGRLNDLIGQRHINLSNLEIFVLDEADRMLDMGFIHDVKKVLALLPPKRQTLLFSATMPDEIVSLADSLLHNPAKVFVTPASTTVESIEQTLYKVDKVNKRHLLAHLLQNPQIDRALVFTRTKHGADRVVRELSRQKIVAKAIHGNKSQTARQDALARFKDGRVKVLVATDIAARGIDIPELSHVFNYDLPNIPETYVHRIGRTGRAGHGGIATSFCCWDELEYLTDIQKLIGFTLPEVTQHQWPMEIFESTAKNNKNNGKKQEPAAQNKQAAKQKKPAATPVAKKAAVPARPAKAQPKQNNKPQAAAAPAAPANRQPQRNTKRAPMQRTPINPYENRTGGSAIITKTPVWGDSYTAQENTGKGDNDMSRNNNSSNNNNRRRNNNNNKNKTRTPKPKQEAAPIKPVKQEAPEIPKNEHGVFDFTEAELAEDKSIKVISRTPVENKYATFEDFLKDH